jgi:zinc transporter ZupT
MSGPIGFYLVGPLEHDQLFFISGFAAGALMAFVTEELLPQAYHKVEVHIGLSATAGFLFVLLVFHTRIPKR